MCGSLPPIQAAVRLLPLCAWRVPLHFQLRRTGDLHEKLDGVGQQHRATRLVEDGGGIKRCLVRAGADAPQPSVLLHVQRRAVCVGAAASGVLRLAAGRAAMGDGGQRLHAPARRHRTARPRVLTVALGGTRRPPAARGDTRAGARAPRAHALRRASTLRLAPCALQPRARCSQRPHPCCPSPVLPTPSPPTLTSRQAHLFIVPAFGSLSEAVAGCEGTAHMQRQAEAAAALRASPWFVKWPQRCAPRLPPALLSLALEVALAQAPPPSPFISFHLPPYQARHTRLESLRR